MGGLLSSRSVATLLSSALSLSLSLVRCSSRQGGQVGKKEEGKWRTREKEFQKGKKELLALDKDKIHDNLFREKAVDVK